MRRHTSTQQTLSGSDVVSLNREMATEIAERVAQTVQASTMLNLKITEMPDRIAGEMKMLNAGMIGLNQDLQRLEKRIGTIDTEMKHLLVEHTKQASTIHDLTRRLTAVEAMAGEVKAEVAAVVDGEMSRRLGGGNIEILDVASQATLDPISDRLADTEEEIDQIKATTDALEGQFKSLDERMMRIFELVSVHKDVVSLQLAHKQSLDEKI